MPWDSRDKMRNDPAFRNLTDMMESFMHQNQFTPSEMREAAVIASIRYYERRPAGLCVPLDAVHQLLNKVEKDAEYE